MKIKSIRAGATIPTADFEVPGTHAYHMGNGIVSHNSSTSIYMDSSASVLPVYEAFFSEDNKNGKMVVAAGGRVTGPGHFGRFIIGDGIEKMSCHYEADLDQSGRSVLAIRPLLWKNGWPVAGDNFKEGTYEIESERRG